MKWLFAFIFLFSIVNADEITTGNLITNGNFAAQPNNRCIWDLPSFTVKDNIPDWKVQSNSWNVEDTGAWKTEDTDNFFYEIEEKK